MNRKELIKEISSEKDINKSLLKCLNIRELEILCKMDDDKFENMMTIGNVRNEIKEYKRATKRCKSVSVATIGCSFLLTGVCGLCGLVLTAGLLSLATFMLACILMNRSSLAKIREIRYFKNKLEEIIDVEIRDKADKFSSAYKVDADEKLEDISLPEKESGKQQSRGMEK